MENKQIENLYIFGAHIAPKELSDGTWRWVVLNFGYGSPNLYDDEGTSLDDALFSFKGDSKEELLDPFNG
jgi:hypothetical protein